MTWQRAINLARVFKKKEEVDDDALSFACIGLPPHNNGWVTDCMHIEEDEVPKGPQETPLPDLPWESRHDEVAARPLRSVRHLSVTPVLKVDIRYTEVHVRAPGRASSAPPPPPTQSNIAAKSSHLPRRDSCTEAQIVGNLPDFSVSSTGQRPDRRLCSHRGLRIGEKSRINLHEGNRLKMKEICAGYLYEPKSSEDEKEKELMFPTITPHTSKLNQEEAKLLSLENFRENVIFSEEDLVEEHICVMEEVCTMASPSEDNMEDKNALSANEAVRESTAEEQEATPEPSTIIQASPSENSMEDKNGQSADKRVLESTIQVQEQEATPMPDATIQAKEEVEKCPSPVPSLEFEPLLPVTDYQRRLREETRKALLLTEARRKRTGSRV